MTSDLDRFRAVHTRILRGEIPQRNRRYAFINCVEADWERFEKTLWLAWREGLVDLVGDFFLWQHLANRPDDYTIDDLIGIYRELAPAFRTRRSRYDHAIRGWHGELDRLLWPRVSEAAALIPLLDEVDGFFRSALAYALARHGVLPASALPDGLQEVVAIDLYSTIGAGDGFARWQHVWPMEEFGPLVLKKWLAEGEKMTNNRAALAECARHAAPEDRLAFIKKTAFLSGPDLYPLVAEFADELRPVLSAELDQMVESTWERPSQAGVYLTAAAQGLALIPPRWDALLGDAMNAEGNTDAIRRHLFPLMAALPKARRQAITARTERSYPWQAVATCATAQTAAAAVPRITNSTDRITAVQIEALASLWDHLPPLLSRRKRDRWLRPFFSPGPGGLFRTPGADTPGRDRWLSALKRASTPGILATIRYLQAHWNDYRDPFELDIPLDDQLVGLLLWCSLLTRTGQAYQIPTPLQNLWPRLSDADRAGLVVAMQELAWCCPDESAAEEVARKLTDNLGAPWAEHAARFLSDRPPHAALYVKHLLLQKLDEHPVLIPLAVQALGSDSADLRHRARAALKRLDSRQLSTLHERLAESPINIGIAEMLEETPSADHVAPAQAALATGQPAASRRALLGLIITASPITPDAPESALVALDPGPTVAAPALSWDDGSAVAPGAARWLSAALSLESDARHHPALTGLCLHLSAESRARLLQADDRPHTRVFLDPGGIPAWCARIDPVAGTDKRAFSSEVAILRRCRLPIVARYLQRWARAARRDRDLEAARQALRQRCEVEGDALDVLAESAVPTHGFSTDGTRPMGTLILHLQADGEIRIEAPGAKRLRKTLPAGQGDKAALRSLKREIERDLIDQRARLRRAWMSGRSWTEAEWDALRRHPIHRLWIAQWTTEPIGAVIRLRPPERHPPATADDIESFLASNPRQERSLFTGQFMMLGFFPRDEKQPHQGGELYLPGGWLVSIRTNSPGKLGLQGVAVRRHGEHCALSDLPPSLLRGVRALLRMLMMA